MAKVMIMTDSNSGITPAQATEFGVDVLPMPVLVNGNEYSENVDLSHDEFLQCWRKMRRYPPLSRRRER